MKKQPEIENLERREHVRIDHTSALKIQELKSGKNHNARMFNYSKNGLYFESDSKLDAGETIHIAIEDSPYSIKAGVRELYNAEIKWRKKCKDSHFDFGYGVKLLPSTNANSAKLDKITNRKNLVKNSIGSDTKSLIFNLGDKTYEGVIKDLSSSGVFLSCQDTLELGEIVGLVLPLKNGRKTKIEGQIIWTDNNGIGVVFLR